MIKLDISVVKDGKYLGVSNGTKVLMIRDAFGVPVEKFEHLIPVFEGPERYIDIMPPDLQLLVNEFEASIDTLNTPTESVDLRADKLFDGDRDIAESDVEGNRP